MHDSDHQDGKLDLVPMIDCVMLLLLFFILTTKFTTEEKVLSALLPTDKGAMGPPRPLPPVVLKQINIVAYPDGMERGHQPSDYQRQFQHMTDDNHGLFPAILVRIGGSQPIRIDGRQLAVRGSAESQAQIATLHRYIASELQNRESAAGPRRDQPTICLQCFSGLPWKYAVVLYDAVRAFEQQKTGVDNAHLALADAREVMFAPPRIRNYTPNERGNELYEIIHAR